VRPGGIVTPLMNTRDPVSRSSSSTTSAVVWSTDMGWATEAARNSTATRTSVGN
jgi:hypothetical protein